MDRRVGVTEDPTVPTDADSGEFEAILQALGVDERLREGARPALAVAVVGPNGDGLRTSLAINLTLCAARRGSHVALIDAAEHDAKLTRAIRRAAQTPALDQGAFYLAADQVVLALPQAFASMAYASPSPFQHAIAAGATATPAFGIDCPDASVHAAGVRVPLGSAAPFYPIENLTMKSHCFVFTALSFLALATGLLVAVLTGCASAPATTSTEQVVPTAAVATSPALPAKLADAPILGTEPAARGVYLPIDRRTPLNDQALARAQEAKDGALRKRLVDFAAAAEKARGLFVPIKEVDGITGEERIREKMSNVYFAINEYRGGPSRSQLDRIDALAKDQVREAGTFEKLATEQLASLNAALAAAGQTPMALLDRAAWEAKTARK